MSLCVMGETMATDWDPRENVRREGRGLRGACKDQRQGGQSLWRTLKGGCPHGAPRGKHVTKETVTKGMKWGWASFSKKGLKCDLSF